MPARKSGEKLSEFIGKFMRDKHDKAKWKPKQRLAVAYSEARKHAGKA
jgi:hypothetical protein